MFLTSQEKVRVPGIEPTPRGRSASGSLREGLPSATSSDKRRVLKRTTLVPGTVYRSNYKRFTYLLHDPPPTSGYGEGGTSRSGNVPCASVRPFVQTPRSYLLWGPVRRGLRFGFPDRRNDPSAPRNVTSRKGVSRRRTLLYLDPIPPRPGTTPERGRRGGSLDSKTPVSESSVDVHRLGR